MLFTFTPKGMEMEQIQIMGMELEQSWIIAGGVGAVLLIALVWFLARRGSKNDGESDADEGSRDEIRLTEPTLEPLPEVSGETDTEAADAEAPVEAAGEPAESRAPEPAAAAEPEPETEPKAEAEPKPQGEPAAAETATPETEPASDREPDPASPETGAIEPEPEPERERETEAPVAAETTEPSDTPEPPLVADPAFLAAREAFERELLGGNFSRLDVFDAYAKAQGGPDDPGVPRSEFFHHVVNQALKARDAFEILLADEDREQFVDIHSRYLDDVTEESDADARARLHREHQEKLGSLRPKSANAA